MIGVCIPAHNEAQSIVACLASVWAAATQPQLDGRQVKIVVVHDSCTDDTAQLSAQWPVVCLHLQVRNVGLARAAGAQYLVEQGAQWLAFTDADSVVSPLWLVHQLALKSDVVCGTVEVTDWSEYGELAAQAQRVFEAGYQDKDGHRHVHGANLGISAAAYLHAGGFEALTCSEDQALVDKLTQLGRCVAWSALPRVTTSARPISRVEGGFATTLREGALRQDGAAHPA